MSLKGHGASHAPMLFQNFKIGDNFEQNRLTFFVILPDPCTLILIALPAIKIK